MRGGVRLLVSVVLALEAGCAPGHTPEPPVSVRDSAGVSIVTINADPATLPLRSLESEPDLVIEGGMDGIPDFVGLGAVRWLSDGRILVADAAASVLYLFDTSGSLVRSFGRPGEGPGEFRYVNNMTVGPGDSVLVFDERTRRGTVLHPTGGFQRTVPVPGPATLGASPLDLSLFGSHRLIAHRYRFEDSLLKQGVEIQRSRTFEDLLLFGTDGSLLDSTPAFEGRHGVWTAKAEYRAPWSARPFVAADTSRVAYGPGATWRVTVLDSDFRVAREIVWPKAEEALRGAEVMEFRAQVRSSYLAEMGAARIDRTLDILFSPAILPEIRPAIGRVLLDSDGPIWVGRFKPLSWPIPWEPTDWVVLSAEGTPMVRVVLPETMRLEEVRGDSLLVVVTDSLDVEHVAVYVVREQGIGSRE